MKLLLSKLRGGGNTPAGTSTADTATKTTKKSRRNSSSGTNPQSPPRIIRRRNSTSSATSDATTEASKGFEGSFDEQQLRVHNQHLTSEITTLELRCQHLEDQYRQAREDLTYTKASMQDQFQQRLMETQALLRQQQQQDEQVQNQSLFEDFDLLDEYKSELESLETKLEQSQKELSQRQGHFKEETTKLREENATLQSKLEEASQRIERLEEELQNFKDDREFFDTEEELTDDSMHSETEESQRLLYLKSDSPGRRPREEFLNKQIEQLEETLESVKQDQELQNILQCRQILEWKQHTYRFQQEVKELEESRTKEETLNESCSLEYSKRIEHLEISNQELQHRLNSQEEQYAHKLRLQQRTIESLQMRLQESHDNNSKYHTSSKQQESSARSMENPSSYHNRSSHPNKEHVLSPGDNTVATEETLSHCTPTKDAVLLEELEEARTRERLVKQQLDNMTHSCELAHQRTVEAEQRVEMLQTYLEDDTPMQMIAIPQQRPQVNAEWLQEKLKEEKTRVSQRHMQRLETVREQCKEWLPPKHA